VWRFATMKIAVLGCGGIGSVAAGDLARSLRTAEIVVADADGGRARTLASRLNRGNVSWMRTDASSHGSLVRALKRFDLAVGALPGSLGFAACRAAIDARTHMVDVSYMPEDVTALSRAALQARVCVVPDCGVSPGLSNVLIGHAVSRLDTVDSVHILVGGLPEKPVPPLGYVITWSADDLIDLYQRPATIVRKGRACTVDAMSGLEEIDVPGLGSLEAFYSDGLRTLLHTIPGAEDMWEKTLRYPGHVRNIRLLQSLGFFRHDPLEIHGRRVRPREVTARLLDRTLRMPGVRDLVVMTVAVAGVRNGKSLTYTYRLLDKFDARKKITAMARTTAFTASVVAQLIARGVVAEVGVVPPETLGMNPRVFGEFRREIRKRRIVVTESRMLT
jgi:lysine 6-dehydrogenase